MIGSASPQLFTTSPSTKPSAQKHSRIRRKQQKNFSGTLHTSNMKKLLFVLLLVAAAIHATHADKEAVEIDRSNSQGAAQDDIAQDDIASDDVGDVPDDDSDLPDADREILANSALREDQADFDGGAHRTALDVILGSKDRQLVCPGGSGRCPGTGFCCRTRRCCPLQCCPDFLNLCRYGRCIRSDGFGLCRFGGRTVLGRLCSPRICCAGRYNRCARVVRTGRIVCIDRFRLVPCGTPPRPGRLCTNGKCCRFPYRCCGSGCCR